MSRNLLTIQTFFNVMDAEIIRGKLRSSGINAYIIKDDCGGTDPMMQPMFGVKVKVDFRDEKNALKVINQLRPPKQQPNAIANEKKASMVSFIILMINSTGAGLLLSGFFYYKSLVLYGLILLILGSTAFFIRLFLNR